LEYSVAEEVESGSEVDSDSKWSEVGSEPKWASGWVANSEEESVWEKQD
jgi:hypothetical protein